MYIYIFRERECVCVCVVVYAARDFARLAALASMSNKVTIYGCVCIGLTRINYICAATHKERRFQFRLG